MKFFILRPPTDWARRAASFEPTFETRRQRERFHFFHFFSISSEKIDLGSYNPGHAPRPPRAKPDPWSCPVGSYDEVRGRICRDLASLSIFFYLREATFSTFSFWGRARMPVRQPVSQSITFHIDITIIAETNVYSWHIYWCASTYAGYLQA